MPEMTKGEREEAFEAELIELSRKYGIIIGACGCCYSPWYVHKDEVDPDIPEAYNSIPSMRDVGWVSPPKDPTFSMDD